MSGNNNRELTVMLRLAADQPGSAAAIAQTVTAVTQAQDALNASHLTSQRISRDTAAAQQTSHSQASEAITRQNAQQRQLTDSMQQTLDGARSLGAEMRLFSASVGEAVPADVVRSLSELVAAQQAAVGTLTEAQNDLRTSTGELAGQYDELAIAVQNNDLAGQNQILAAIADQETIVAEAIESHTQAQEALNRVNQERIRITGEIETAEATIATNQKRLIGDARQLTTGLTHMARALVLAAVAKEDDAKAALQMVAGFESIAQGLHGTIAVVNEASEMWLRYRTIREAANQIGTLRGLAPTIVSGIPAAASMAGGIGSTAVPVAAGAGIGGAAGVTSAVSAIGAIAAPAAAFIAAIGGMGLAAKIVWEQLSGAADDADSWSMTIANAQLNLLKSSPMGGDGMIGSIARTAFKYNLAGVVMGADDINQSITSGHAVKRGEKRLTAEQARQAELNEKFNKYGRLEDQQTERDRAREMQSATFGLSGSAKSQAENDLRKQTAMQDVKDLDPWNASADAINAQVEKVTAAYGTLVDVEYNRLDIAKQTASESIAAQQTQLDLAREQLTAASQARDAAKSDRDRAAGILAHADPEQMEQMQAAAAQAKAGNLTVEGADALSGFKQFDQQREQAYLDEARRRDVGGELFQPLDKDFTDKDGIAQTLKLELNKTESFLIEFGTTNDANIAKLTAEISAAVKAMNLVTPEQVKDMILEKMQEGNRTRE